MDSAHSGNACDGVATAKAAAAMINGLMVYAWVVVLPDWVRLWLAAWGLGGQCAERAERCFHIS